MEAEVTLDDAETRRADMACVVGFLSSQCAECACCASCHNATAAVAPKAYAGFDARTHRVDSSAIGSLPGWGLCAARM